MGDEFSKTALDKYRKTGQPLKCKRCVAATEKAERDAAAAKREKEHVKDGETATADNGGDKEENRICAGSCQQELPQSAYNRNQWSKGDGKSRCRSCVEKALQDERTQQ